MPVIFEDTRNQLKKHELKRSYFEERGWTIERTKLFVGDYMLPGGLVSIDTKKDIYELASNMRQQHDRFRRECERAQEAGYELVVLVENDDGVWDLDALVDWIEPMDHYMMRKRKSGGNAKRITGTSLYKSCKTMSRKYGVKFAFCPPATAGYVVLTILEEGKYGPVDA